MKGSQLTKKLKLRRLTKNERVLLAILGAVLIFWSAFRFVIDPQMTKLEELREKKMEYTEQIAEMNRTLKNEESINDQWISLHREKDLILSKYFSSLDQPEIIYLLNEILDSEEIHILDMSFNTPNEEQIEDLIVNTMDITLPYRGNYEGLKDVIRSINSSPKKILLSNLIVDRDMDTELAGNIGLKIYSLEGISHMDEELAYIDTESIEGKSNPFTAFEGFQREEEIEKEEESIDSINPIDSANMSNIPESREEIVNNYYSEVLEDFEGIGLYFMPSHKNIKGRLSKSTNSKYKKHSLKLEYNILAVEDENKVYIDLTDKNLVIKYPPNSLGIWVHSYSYSPAILGLRLKGQAGEKVDLELSKGVNWIGWKYLEKNPPEDLSIYPLQLDKIYVELAYDRDDYGVLLFDKLKANYPKDSNKSKEKFTFYIVENGDTLDKISTKFYGSGNKKNTIMKYNEIKSDRDLIEGKILVIPR